MQKEFQGCLSAPEKGRRAEQSSNQRTGFPGGSAGEEPSRRAGDRALNPGSQGFLGGGNGYPLGVLFLFFSILFLFGQ